jgi:branched-chain amino acid transport system permease protein
MTESIWVSTFSTLAQLVGVVITGLAVGVPLFLTASGLTLIYGVMRVLNFAHGALFMLGAYGVATYFSTGAPGGFPMAVVAATIAGALLGVVIERLVFRRLYGADEIVGLLASYALLLSLIGVSQIIWGVNPLSIPIPPALSRAIQEGPIVIGHYYVLLIAAGVLVALLLWLVVTRTPFGRAVRATAYDREMASAVGIPVGLVGAGVFALGSGLAGFAGALESPLVAVDASLAFSFIIQAFAVVLIGGLGSIAGSLVGAITLGVVEALIISYAPSVSGYTVYGTLAIIMLARTFIPAFRRADELEVLG